MDTSTIENEKWLIERLSKGEDNLEHLKAFFTCAFIAGATHHREFGVSKDDPSGAMDRVLEREWDKTVTMIRGIIASGAVTNAKARIKMGKGFDA